MTLSLCRTGLQMLFAASLVFGAASPAAAQDTARAARIIAEDAAAYFSGLCIATRADPARIGETIEARRLAALPLTEEDVRNMLGGRPGDLGWMVKTARGVGLSLHVSPPAICEIHTTDLDDGALQAAMETVLRALAESSGFTYEKAMDERRPTNGGEQHLVGYRLKWRGGDVGGKVAVSHIAGDGNDIPRQARLSLTVEQLS